MQDTDPPTYHLPFREFVIRRYKQYISLHQREQAVEPERQGDLQGANKRECRGRQPFAGARGALASLLPPRRPGRQNRTWKSPWRKIVKEANRV
jgi:hypothetical protein